MQLAVQFQHLGTPIVDAVRAAGERMARIKLVNPPPTNPFPGHIVVGRLEQAGGRRLRRGQRIDEAPYLADGAAGAERWWADYGAWLETCSWVSAWEFPNRPAVADEGQARQVAACVLRWLELADEQGLRGVVLNFAAGTPAVELAPLFGDVVRYAAAHGHSIGFHETLCLRSTENVLLSADALGFPRFFQALAEAGIDAQPEVEITTCEPGAEEAGAAASGYHAGRSEEEYLGDLSACRDLMAAYPYVRTAYVFCAGYSRSRQDREVPARLVATASESNPVAIASEIIQEPPIQIVNVCYDADGFAAYVAQLEFPQPMPNRLVLHHTYRPTPDTWHGSDTMLAMKRYYEQQQWTDEQGQVHSGWTAGPHIFVAPDGIWLFTDLRETGVGVKGIDETMARHVEMVGDYDAQLPSGAVLSNTIAVLGALCLKMGLQPEQINFHRDFSTKTCPGTAVTKAWVFPQVTAWIKARQNPSALEKRLGDFIQGYVIPQNPAAAFYAYGRARGWEPISGEVDYEGYRAQVWYSPSNQMQHIIYTLIGDWGNLRHFDRKN